MSEHTTALPPCATVRLTPASDRRHPCPTRPLTPREEEVARLLAAGHTQDIIAETLGCGPDTVREHVRRIADKLPMAEFRPHMRVVVWAFWEYRAAA